MDFGDGVSHTMTIYEGYAVLHAILRFIRLAVFFQVKFLIERKCPFTTTAERWIGRDVQEKLCYMSFDYDTKLESTREGSDKIHTYGHPDRNIISLSAPDVSVARVFFSCFIGIHASGLYDTSFQSNISVTSKSARRYVVKSIPPNTENWLRKLYAMTRAMRTSMRPTTA